MTNLDSLVLDFSKLEQLFLTQIAIGLDYLFLVLALMRKKIRCRVVCVFWRWNKLPRTHASHALLVNLHVVVFFVWECRYLWTSLQCENIARQCLVTCIVVLHEASEFLLALVLGHRLRIYFPFFNEPRMELWSFSEHAMGRHTAVPYAGKGTMAHSASEMIPYFPH